MHGLCRGCAWNMQVRLCMAFTREHWECSHACMERARVCKESLCRACTGRVVRACMECEKRAYVKLARGHARSVQSEHPHSICIRARMEHAARACMEHAASVRAVLAESMHGACEKSMQKEHARSTRLRLCTERARARGEHARSTPSEDTRIRCVQERRDHPPQHTGPCTQEPGAARSRGGCASMRACPSAHTRRQPKWGAPSSPPPRLPGCTVP